jgi:hypothetical protein
MKIKWLKIGAITLAVVSVCLIAHAVEFPGKCATTTVTTGGTCPDPCGLQDCTTTTTTTSKCVSGNFICFDYFCAGTSTTKGTPSDCSPPPTNCDCEPIATM